MILKNTYMPIKFLILVKYLRIKFNIYEIGLFAKSQKAE